MVIGLDPEAQAENPKDDLCFLIDFKKKCCKKYKKGKKNCKDCPKINR